MTKPERRKVIAKLARARKVSEAQRRRWARIRAQRSGHEPEPDDVPFDDVMDLLERLG